MKYVGDPADGEGARSPPSRGAWIEIIVPHAALCCVPVAPLAGGVD